MEEPPFDNLIGAGIVGLSSVLTSKSNCDVLPKRRLFIPNFRACSDFQGKFVFQGNKVKFIGSIKFVF